MIAPLAIDRTDQREPVHHRRLPRQVLADLDPRNRRRDRLKRPAILARPLRLHVPDIQMARPTRHPQQDDALARARLAPLGPAAKQVGKRQAGDPRQPGLQHPAAGLEDESFTGRAMEIPEGMTRMGAHMTAWGRHRQLRLLANRQGRLPEPGADTTPGEGTGPSPPQQADLQPATPTAGIRNQELGVRS